ncbi:response regulator transcription factor [Lichenifustis flavocetrariae]|uniref:Response regulator transcription factor n=1 Tax=Lichenifustis flavocetrariae TaxID=2949735 RepID=A0AA41YZU8_9HYPH|nr:response regulator transcription factor [Lichenifustis flavocetrariae]MCW6510346.1 response regulator transcription factor [Lichenifustis flavocetrariae]
MKMLIVDDHPIIREGLVALFRQIGAETVILQAGTAAEGLRLLTQHADLDVVVLDLVMPGMDGWQAISAFGQARPEVPVVVLSSSENPQDARKALAQGALGYVPKSAGQQTLLSAIRLVLSGDIYLPPLLLTEVSAAPNTALRTVTDQGRSVLTDRQIDVLRKLSEGRSNKAIAFELDIAEKTVKAHVTAIFRALNVVNRTQAVAAGREAGVI